LKVRTCRIEQRHRGVFLLGLSGLIAPVIVGEGAPLNKGTGQLKPVMRQGGWLVRERLPGTDFPAVGSLLQHADMNE